MNSAEHARVGARLVMQQERAIAASEIQAAAGQIMRCQPSRIATLVHCLIAARLRLDERLCLELVDCVW